MSTLTIQSIDGAKVGEFQVSEKLLERSKGGQAVRDAVVTFLANQRAGTASTKTKGEVAGHGAKPWRQKGTGRARAGYRQSPVWRGGGVVFGPKPRSFRQDLNKKTVKLALRRALTEKLDAGSVVLLDSLSLSAAKTKEAAGLIKKLNFADKTVLFMTEGVDKDFVLAVRNLGGVEVATASDVNVYQILRHAVLITTQAAWEKLQQRLGVQEAGA
ncbi:MAG TPA: 50S ribosomal protein L4 [Kiritimatiellia bacterium]|nr:50S ribosomal protein L4 [Kiritimatiellia bacterium]